jgi:hypothetical protein
VTPRRLLLPLLLLAALTPAAADAKLYDFDNDRRQDLVVGLPSWQTSDGEELGAVVAFGSKRKLLGRRVVLTREALGFPPGGPARIGTSVASADFDGDDFEDLALGVPFLDDGGVVAAYGSASGFSPRRTYLGDAESGPLVAGDMNGEGIDDLAIGPGDVALHFGTEAGLTEPPSATLREPAHTSTFFSQFLAHGDVTGDGHAELFAASQGAPFNVSERPVPGHIAIALGGPDGPQAFDWVAQEMRGGPTSLALGDVDGDRYGDLVAGVPINDFFGEDDPGPPGAVNVWWGGPDGLSDKPVTITQDSRGVPGSNEQHDRFGSSVAVGRLDRDRYADIVVSAPEENNQRGRVTIIRGGAAGYARTGNRSFGFETRGVPGSFKRGDRRFGMQLSLLELSGDDRLDLALLDRGADRSNIRRSRRGGVTVLRGTRRGISLRDAARLTFFSEGLVLNEVSEFPVLGRAGSSS